MAAPANRTSVAPTRSNWRIAAVLGLLFALVALFAYYWLTHNKADPDMFWHIKTGQYIAQHRAIPRVDPFSWYGQEKQLSWGPMEWLFGLALHATYTLGGFRLVYVAAALLVGLLMVAVALYTHRTTRSWSTSLIVGMVATLGIAHFYAPRPQLVTFVLLVFCAILLDSRRWIPALAVFWLGVNLHGAVYPVYLLLFAYYTLTEDKLLPLRRWLNPRTGVFLAALVVPMITPLGPPMLRYPFFSLGSKWPALLEWTATAPKNHPVYALTLLALFALLDRQRIPLRTLLYSLVLLVLSLMAVRHTAYLFVLGLPVLAPYLGRVSEPDEHGEGVRSDAGDWVFDNAIVATLAVAVAIMGAMTLRAEVDVERGYPRDAVAWVKSQPVRRIWNDWADGGYLIWKGLPPLVDGRTDLFMTYFNPETTVAQDYETAWHLGGDPRVLFDRYGIERAIMSRQLPLYRAVEHDSRFKEVYGDAEYVVLDYE